MRRAPCLAALVALGAGCVTFPPPERGAEDAAVPASYTLYGAGDAAPARWWEAFGSEELNGLVEAAIAENLTLQQAAARIVQAASIARQNRAALFPELGYTASATGTATHRDAGFGTVGAPTAFDRLNALDRLLNPPATMGGGGVLDAINRVSTQAGNVQTLFAEEPEDDRTIRDDAYDAGLTASYEADIWGRLRASRNAADLDLVATREDLVAAIHSIVAQVVTTWLDIIEVRQTLAVTRSQIETNQATLGLNRVRFRNGLASALDVLQQQEVVAQTEAIVPLLEAQLRVLSNQLAVLLGQPAASDLGLATDTLPELDALPDYGLPADLLAHRPDVRAAGLDLQAADWRVSAARADRLPSLRLSASFTFNGSELNTLFDNWIASLAASVTGPIFDAGARKAEVERTRAVVAERLAAYRLAVLTAVQEVEDALVLIDRQEAFLVALRAQFDAASASADESLNRYRKGLNDYLPVLTALTNKQNLERSLIEAENDLRTLRVQLHLALGGDWVDPAAIDLPEEYAHEFVAEQPA